MKYSAWLTVPVLSLWLAAEALAQFPILLPPVVYPAAPVNTGIFAQFRTGRLTIQGYATTGFPPNTLIVMPPGFPPPVFVPPILPVAPYGYIDSRVSYNFITARPVIIAPGAADYDLRGVDLDLAPANGARQAPPAAAGRMPQPEPRPAAAAPKVRDPEPAPARPAEIAGLDPQMPGKEVSVPRQAIRPEDLVQKPADPPRKPIPLPEPKDPALGPGEEVERQLLLGKEAFKAGEYGLAAQRFRRANQTNPNEGRPYFYLAQAYFALGRYHEAMDSIIDGMGMQRNWPAGTQRPRSELYPGRENEFERHLKQLEAAVAREPMSYPLVFLLAHQRWFDGQRDAAVDLFRRARDLTINPTYVDRFLAAAPAKMAAK